MIWKFLKSLVSSEKGATAIEYTLIAALISVVCIIAFRSLGTTMNDKMTEITTGIKSVVGVDGDGDGICGTPSVD